MTYLEGLSYDEKQRVARQLGMRSFLDFFHPDNGDGIRNRNTDTEMAELGVEVWRAMVDENKALSHRRRDGWNPIYQYFESDNHRYQVHAAVEITRRARKAVAR